MRDRITITGYRVDRPPAEVTITRLGPVADDLLLLGQRLKMGVPDDKRDDTAAAVRRAAARHPNDPFALLQLGHAELHFGDRATGEAVLLRLLEMEPKNVEALLLMANERFRQASEIEDDDAASRARLREGRAFLARAFEAEPENYHTLMMLADSRSTAPTYPNENDLLTWSAAFDRAPQLPSIRFGYAGALMQAGNTEEAVVLLEPIANAPHNSGMAEAAQDMIDRARAGQGPLDEAALKAAAEAPPDEPLPPGPGAEPGATPQPAEGEPAPGD